MFLLGLEASGQPPWCLSELQHRKTMACVIQTGLDLGPYLVFCDMEDDTQLWLYGQPLAVTRLMAIVCPDVGPCG